MKTITEVNQHEKCIQIKYGLNELAAQIKHKRHSQHCL